MRNKVFIVTHAKARHPLTIKGKTLEDALEKGGLDGNFWKETAQDHKVAEPENGNNQGDDRPEDY